MTRIKLPDRRLGLRVPLDFTHASGNVTHFDISFGFDADLRIREVFCLAFKSGTELQDILHQSCIALSRSLQHGETLCGCAHAIAEGDPVKDPRSIFGLIVRVGAFYEAHVCAAHALDQVAALMHGEPTCEPWVIRRRGYFYRPDRAGYTSDIMQAGLYTKAEAIAEVAIEPSIMSAHPRSEFAQEMPL